MIKRILFRIAKCPLMGSIVGFAFQYFNNVIPVKKVWNGERTIAFNHPKPAYNNHIVITPKKPIRNLLVMAQDNYEDFFVDVWHVIEEIVGINTAFKDGFVVVANGGKRQEVQQVHFHLFSGKKIVDGDAVSWQSEKIIYKDDFAEIALLTEDSGTHIAIHKNSMSKDIDESNFLKSVLHSLVILNEKYDLVKNGYSLIYQNYGESENPIIHIVSG